MCVVCVGVSEGECVCVCECVCVRARVSVCVKSLSASLGGRAELQDFEASRL